MRAERDGWRQAGPLTWMLAAACGWALLLWLAALMGMGERLQPLPAVDPGPLPAVAEQAPLRIGALAQYAEAAHRPLFTDDRRPHAFVASVDGDGAEGGGGLDFALTGVLISPQVRLAILQPAGGGESQRVREGAAVEGAPGWRLLELQPHRAIFDGSSGQATLELRRFGGDGAPAGEPKAAPADPARAEVEAELRKAAGLPDPDEARRIEDIRRRIEARRAQLKQHPPVDDGGGRLRPLSGTQ